MKCIIPGNHVKVFGRAIHSLSKIGDELYIEPMENGLALRTVNSSRSAYACFLFNPSFFHEYNDGRQPPSQGSEDETLKCKIAMKSCLSVFRSLSSIEKTVERCQLTLNIDEARLVFQLYCRHGIVKTHNLAFIECETLQAVFSSDDSSNHLTAQSRLLCDVVANFQNNQEEITLTVSSDRVSFKNYCDDVADPNKLMHTELSLDCDEFDTYKVDENSDVTFCLKELRAILSFIEATNLPLSLHFDTAGKPIIFSMDGDHLFEASFVLATLADPTNANCTQQTQDNHKNTSRNVRKTGLSTSKSRSDDTTLDIRSETIVQNHQTNRSITNNIGQRTSQIPSSNPTSQPIHNHHNPMTIEPTTKLTVQAMVHHNIKPMTNDERNSSGSSESPVIPNVAQNMDTSRLDDITVNENMDEDEMNDTIPGTPPNKKFKSLFFGLSQSTYRSQSQPHSEVLAQNTDDEDDD